MRPLTLLLLVAVASLSGCIGNIRDTTTVRSAHEILLVSTAAQRALREYDASPLSRRRVFVDLRYFDSIDKSYVESSLREEGPDAATRHRSSTTRGRRAPAPDPAARHEAMSAVRH